MKTQAWQFSALGTPDRLNLIEHDLPEPGAGEALIRITAIGLNNSDARWIAGTYIMPPKLPAFIGQEAVGEIIALGAPKADSASPAGYTYKVGDKVALMFGRVDMGNMGVIRKHGIYPTKALLPVPDSFSDGESAALWIASATAWGGLHTAGMTAKNSMDKTVLITAASSGVGTIALQIATAWSARTIGTTRSEDKAEHLHSIADHVLILPSGVDLAEAMQGLPGGKGVDVVFDPVGIAYTSAFFQLIKTYGQIVFYERITGTIGELDLKAMIGKEISLHGFTVYRFIRNPHLLDTMIKEVMEMATKGKIKPIIDREFAFADAPNALNYLIQGEHVGKIIITVSR
ncbi:MAG: zinc-binding dehydrogenase [Aggregatilineales bacterium]